MKDVAETSEKARKMAAARLRSSITRIPNSLIREVASRGMGREDVLALWFGEGDLPTPPFIVEAAKRALDVGHVFYTENRGIPALREALARYLSDLYGVSVGAERVTVTASGMSALTVAMQTLVEAGDSVVVTGPVWPNCVEAARIAGAEARIARLERDAHGWRLDVERLIDALDDTTRAVIVNSPGNPTGWVMPTAQQRVLLDVCRDRGIWIVADEVYDRLVYDGRHAPSFLQIAGPDDPLLVINSFSKTWCMTGWRIGWMVTPARLGPELDKVIEFNYSCTASFTQHAAIAAVERGEPFIARLVARYRAARDLVYERLAAMERVHLARPQAAFYAFFAVDGMDDSTAFAIRLLERTGVGLAPGAAFGPGGEGHLRLCFAARTDVLNRALDRLEDFLTDRLAD